MSWFTPMALPRQPQSGQEMWLCGSRIVFLGGESIRALTPPAQSGASLGAAEAAATWQWSQPHRASATASAPAVSSGHDEVVAMQRRWSHEARLAVSERRAEPQYEPQQNFQKPQDTVVGIGSATVAHAVDVSDATRLSVPREALRRMAQAAQATNRSESEIWAEAAREWLARRVRSVEDGTDNEPPPAAPAAASLPLRPRVRSWKAIDALLVELRAPQADTSVA